MKTSQKMRSLHDERSSSATERTRIVKEHQYCRIQPLFRALVIIINSRDYRLEDSKSLGRMPVFVAHTGLEEGLSAPVTFDSLGDRVEICPGVIKTTLETAIGIVINLEARERAVRPAARSSGRAQGQP